MLRKPIVGIIGFSDGDPEVHEELKDIVQKQVDVIEVISSIWQSPYPPRRKP